MTSTISSGTGEGGGAPLEPRALVEAVAAHDWPRVVEIVRADWLGLIIDHLVTVRWLYRVLPPEVVDGDWLLRAGRDLVTLTNEKPLGALLPEDEAELEAVGRSEAAREVMVTGIARSMMLRGRAQFGPSARMAGQLETIARVASRVQSAAVADVTGVGWLQWGICRLLAGALDDAAEDFRRAYRANLYTGVVGLAGNAAGNVALCAAMVGDTVEAGSWSEREADLPRPDGWLGERAHVGGSAARVVVAADRLDPDGAADALERLQTLREPEELWPFVAHAFAQHGLLFGQPLEALRQLDYVKKTREHRVGDGIAGPLIRADSAELLLAAGLGDRARVLLEADGCSYLPLAVTAARLDLLSGRPEEALTTATRLLWQHEPTPPRARFDLLLIVAAAEDRLCRGDRAVAALAQVVDLAVRYSLLRPLVTVPRAVLRSYVDRVVGLGDLLDIPLLRCAPDLFPERVELIHLTKRETALLEILATGLEIEAIARQWYVSVSTVRAQRATLYKKLGVHSRPAALVRARELGLLQIEGQV